MRTECISLLGYDVLYNLGSPLPHHARNILEQSPSLVHELVEYGGIQDKSDDDLIMTCIQPFHDLLREVVERHSDIGARFAHVFVELG